MAATREGERVTYTSRRRSENEPSLSVTYDIGAPLGTSFVGTLEHFLLERYLLFVEKRGVILKGQVHHAPYPVRRAELVSLHDELVSAAGLPASDGKFETVHYSDGVEVEVFGPLP
jgi:uncharacterized protein